MQRLNHLGQAVGEPLDDWQPRPQPERITMDGQYCRLIPLQPEHARDLSTAFAGDKEGGSFTWLLHQPLHGEAEWQAWVDSKVESTDPLFFSIFDKALGQVTGVFSLMRIDPQNGVIEVGHVHFSPLLSRTRVATEAHWLLMRYAFETLGYRRYEWKCDSLNAASRQAALRLGFQFEGVFRQALVYKGRTRDTAWFSIIDGEWPQCDRAFQRWLAADNFDEHDVQRHSLGALRIG